MDVTGGRGSECISHNGFSDSELAQNMCWGGQRWVGSSWHFISLREQIETELAYQHIDM